MPLPDGMRLTIVWFKRRLATLAGNIDGATAIEYALIATLISVAIIGGATALGTNLNATWLHVSNYIDPNLAH